MREGKGMAKKGEDGTPRGQGGVGRKEEAKGSGVYPASLGPDQIPEDAEVRTQAAWGQGERGAEGYDDSGASELSFTLEEAEAYQRQKGEKDRKEKPET